MHKNQTIPKGAVMFSCIGTIGKCGIASEPTLTNQQINSIVTSEAYDGVFVYYLLRHYAPIVKSIAEGGGSAVPIINKTVFSDIKLRVPGLGVQKEIARLLAAYDDLIANNRRRIECLEEAARLLYQEWFVRLRFPGHEDVAVVDGMPEEWRRITVGEVGRVVTGKTPSKKRDSNYGDEVPFIKTPSMHGLPVVSESEEYLSKSGAASQLKKGIPRGSVMVSCIGTLGVVSMNACLVHTNQQINSIVPHRDTDRLYIYEAMCHSLPQLEAMSAGATMPNVSKGKFCCYSSFATSRSHIGRVQRCMYSCLFADRTATQTKSAPRGGSRHPFAPPDERRDHAMSAFTEDLLVQQTAADYLRDVLGWESVMGWNQETFGPDGTLGRLSEKEIVLTRYLRPALERLTPGLPHLRLHRRRQPDHRGQRCADALPDQPREPRPPTRRRPGHLPHRRRRTESRPAARLRLRPAREQPLRCRARAVGKGRSLPQRRADIIGFVNGLPLLFVECKRPDKDLRHAYDHNLSDYKDTIPHLFHHNALTVLSNGLDAKVGCFREPVQILRPGSGLDEDEGVVDLETLLKGVCSKAKFIDLLQNSFC